MNERMIEFANKANEHVGYTFKLEDAKQIHELMEKFAELIVRECAALVNRAISEGGVDGRVVKQHFGVEE